MSPAPAGLPVGRRVPVPALQRGGAKRAMLVSSCGHHGTSCPLTFCQASAASRASSSCFRRAPWRSCVSRLTSASSCSRMRSCSVRATVSSGATSLTAASLERDKHQGGVKSTMLDFCVPHLSCSVSTCRVFWCRSSFRVSVWLSSSLMAFPSDDITCMWSERATELWA